ncbi:Fur family ferric uptake transcriptional regulator [Hydrogenispora ethanolica]|uniref:Fur family ferric uptake transcriptional regulator n=1 Tax=Hydrogenispora ethanolica TaxID=1082276 RepID=A0A4R1S844_HYDET|nr:Fur family transcriptional regulator [Hydrogenispora ethanolica]TCL75294.1 Fur family ferric uptake transcriptional regulator [Hydrogenispora ethanolica]
MNIEERIENAVKKMGTRNTQPRQIIAEKMKELGRTGALFSAEELWQELRRTHPEIGRATIFRSIEKLVEFKVLDRIQFEDGDHYFRVCCLEGHHYHLACTRCRRILEFENDSAAQQLSIIAKQANFDIEKRALTIFGCCEACRKNARN